MLIGEFAFEPGVLQPLSELRRLLGQCGWHHGRLVAAYPANWRRLVLDGHTWGPVERQKVALILGKLFLVQHNDPRFNENRWLESAEAYDQGKFRAIVASANPRGVANVVPAADADDEAPAFRARRERVIEQTVDGILGAVRPLLRHSRELVLVDPHFAPETTRYRKTFEALLAEAVAGGRWLRRCEVHLEAKAEVTFFRGECDKLAALVPEGLRVVFLRWKEISGKGQLHPRYVITEHAGIRIDGGLDAKTSGTDTEACLMDPEVCKERRQDYGPTSSRFELVDTYEVVGPKRTVASRR